ncbi:MULTISPECIES: hypothetical protein [Saccharothrix]|uniref:hypothetical protein n=1 Tax=Saccharothrix TaxID=2071 RepID=UPI00093FAB94|nr:hypothetical protein [Saccharothrix sp. CB00851]OKI18713.1 hypothetical protein A6A25_39445 [Saccharothrix sp. CB00851]
MDSNRTNPARLGKAAAAGVLALLPFTATGCAGDDPSGEDAAQPITAVEDDAQLEYFGSDQFVGDEVVVSSVVTWVLGEKSLMLDGSEYGDASLLVLSPDGLGAVEEGDIVNVSGYVEQFVQVNYAEEYGVSDEGVYGLYVDEEFLLADHIWNGPSDSSGTPKPSS